MMKTIHAAKQRKDFVRIVADRVDAPIDSQRIQVIGHFCINVFAGRNWCGRDEAKILFVTRNEFYS